MPKPYDATMRELFELDPVAWLEFLGIPVPDPSQVQVIDSNVSTVTAEADKVVRAGGPEPLIVHTEVLSGRDLSYPEQAFWYHGLLRHRHRVPVWTVVVLLRPIADGPELTGVFEGSVPGRGQNLWFRYDVVRVWLLPPDRLLGAGLPLVPLAAVSNVVPDRLPEVLTAVAERLRDEAGPPLRTTLWAATQILLGLNHSRGRVEDLTGEITTMILGIRGIEESSVYQDIFAKGEAEGRARGEIQGIAETLLRVGRTALGVPDDRVQAAIMAIADRERLDQLSDRITEVSNWDELLASVGSPPA